MRIEAHDRSGREKLLRYCTRAPLSLERLSMTRDGRVAYRLQRPWRRGETHRVMQPVELHLGSLEDRLGDPAEEGASGSGECGSSSSSTSTWTATGDLPCNILYDLYCFEQ